MDYYFILWVFQFLKFFFVFRIFSFYYGVSVESRVQFLLQKLRMLDTYFLFVFVVMVQIEDLNVICFYSCCRLGLEFRDNIAYFFFSSRGSRVSGIFGVCWQQYQRFGIVLEMFSLDQFQDLFLVGQFEFGFLVFLVI